MHNLGLVNFAFTDLTSISCRRPRALKWPVWILFLQVLEVVLELLLNDAGQLDPLYSSHQPLERRQQNIPHLLHHHLNHPSNAALAAPLLASAARIGPAATRLLRLLCSSLFQPGLYSHRRRLARGAYAQVQPTHLPLVPGSSAA